jgi:hypothetical protein
MNGVMLGDAVDFVIETPVPIPVVNEDGYIVLDQIDPTV